MASSTHYFSGKCKWAKVYRPDEKYKKYSVDVLLSMEDYTKLKALKVKNNGKPEDGKMWVTFRRNEEAGPPAVVDASGAAITTSIGNDSEVTCKLDVESFVSAKYGNIVRTSLVMVRVDKLVVYDPDNKPQETRPGDATEVKAPVGASPGVKPRIMF